MNQATRTITADLVHRASSTSEAPHEMLPDYYRQQSEGVHSSLTPMISEQYPLSIKDKRWAGLYVHSLVMGFVSTVLPLTIYPFLMGYLNMEGTQTLSARALLALPWVLRPLLRVLANSIPGSESWRYRRCLLVGWTVANVSLAAISFISIKEPYFPKDKFDPRPLDQLSASEFSLLNLEAPRRGARYVLLMSVSMLGLVLADVGGDTLIEQTANEHFPPMNPGDASIFTRDMSAKRILGMLFAFVFMGLTLNGEDYGGDFDFALNYKTAMMITGFIAIVPTPCAQFFIAERSPGDSSFASCVKPLWAIFDNRALCLLIACRFAAGVLRGVTATPGYPIAMYWANVQPINDNVISFVATLAVMGFIRLAKNKGLAVNHLLLIVVANVLVLVVDCSITMATIWDEVRSKYLWLGMPLLEVLPSTLELVIVHAVLGEVAEPGSTEITRELVTSVSILANTIGTVITKLVDASFDVYNEDILRDSHEVRKDATTVFLVAYGAQLLSLAWIFVLPRRSDAIREWKMRHNSSSSPQLRILLVGTLFAGLCLSILAHVLSVNESTSCRWIAGGSGCE